MWKHFPAKTDALAPEACFAMVSGLLTGVRTPFSGRIQIVGKSPLTNTWADSNSGGSVASHLRRAGFDALVVKGKAAQPTVLVVDDGKVELVPAGPLWGQQIPEAFDTLKARYGGPRDVRVSAIGPAGEGMAKIASVMNDRYHAFGRQGFGAIYGSKNLKAIVVAGARVRPGRRAARRRSAQGHHRTDRKAPQGLLHGDALEPGDRAHLQVPRRGVRYRGAARRLRRRVSRRLEGSVR